MASLADVEYDELEDLWLRLEPAIADLTSLEEVAYAFTDALYARFSDSIALVRTFGTVEMHQLPDVDAAFARSFAAASGIAEAVHEHATVLSLLATRGVEEDWNDRGRSQGHLAIPLVSERFVGAIPMIARLLDEIGFRPVWEGPKSGFVTKSLANVNGVFFVADPRDAVDAEERHIIPATGFVERYDVRTVFGFGGSYLSRHMFVSTIVFARESIPRSQAMKFVPLIGSFKAATTRLVNRGEIFAAR